MLVNLFVPCVLNQRPGNAMSRRPPNHLGPSLSSLILGGNRHRSRELYKISLKFFGSSNSWDAKGFLTA